jgi:hypothetical protein
VLKEKLIPTYFFPDLFLTKKMESQEKIAFGLLSTLAWFCTCKYPEQVLNLYTIDKKFAFQQ